MRKEKLERVLAIAKKARVWTEKYAKTHPYVGTPHDLSCYCGIAAAKLHEMLIAEGISAQICANDSHAFVLVDDYTIDITATQFNREHEPVEIVSMTKSKKRWYWSRQYILHSAKAFREHQRRWEWPRSQWARLGKVAV